MIVYDDGTYEIISRDFRKIQFIKAEDNFANDKETLDFIKKLGKNINLLKNAVYKQYLNEHLLIKF